MSRSRWVCATRKAGFITAWQGISYEDVSNLVRAHVPPELLKGSTSINEIATYVAAETDMFIPPIRNTPLIANDSKSDDSDGEVWDMMDSSFLCKNIKLYSWMIQMYKPGSSSTLLLAS